MLPAWNWLPPAGANPRLDLVPLWVRAWYQLPFIDRVDGRVRCCAAGHEADRVTLRQRFGVRVPGGAPITPGQARYDGGPSSLLASPWAELGPRWAARQFHHRPGGNGLEALGAYGVQAVAQLLVMAREQVAVAVERERHRRSPVCAPRSILT
jgi:hypothetical protein